MKRQEEEEEERCVVVSTLAKRIFIRGWDVWGGPYPHLFPENRTEIARFK